MVDQVPSTGTAQRLEWPHLPPHVRRLVEERCGAEVVGAVSQTSGFTPGFASVLTCADGTRHFVKAASVKAQAMFAESYREEARKLMALPEGVPAPRLRWSHLPERGTDDWVVLGIEHVEGRLPRRPWVAEELDAVLGTLEHMADLLTPAPEGLDLATFTEEHGSFADLWERVGELPGHEGHRAEAVALARDHAQHTEGDTVVHVDVRSDNVLLGSAGEVWVCDWNWPARGAAWLDSVMLLWEPHGDGLDVERIVRERGLLREVPGEAIDSVLALMSGYFLHSAAQPVPAVSPYVRQIQRWQGEACWSWLAQRRGWT